jgi:putative ABC transport system permease protein
MVRAFFNQLWLRVKSLLNRKQLDRDLEDELVHHLDMRAQHNRAAGMNPQEARYAAKRDLGNIARVKEISREMWTFAWLETFWQDLRYGARILAKHPGFSLVAILTLALGIGANTAMFSVVNGVLLNPLPFPESERLVVLYENKVHFEHGAISYLNFLDWQEDNRSFATMAAFRPANFSLTGAGDPERVNAEMISAEFLPILGVQPFSGRMFTSGEDRLGAAPVALISEGYWRRKFGAAPDILGRTLVLDGTGYAVIGVIPANFHLTMNNFFLPPDVYVPIGQWTFDLFRDRATVFGMDAIGRLKPGVTLAQARADMEGVTYHLAEAYPKANAGISASLVPLKQNVVADLQPLLLLLLGAVGFVLLIACVNVANLLLARSTRRAREFGIRSALGASRTRLIRQLLTESILLAAAGGLLGVLLACVGVQAAVKLAMSLRRFGIPRTEEISIDGHVLIFTVALTLLAGILFGVAPAFKTRNRNLQETLKEGVRGTPASRSHAQRLFVVSELAMALILLVGAGLMIRSLVTLLSVSPGFNPNNVVSFYLSLAPSMGKAEPDAIRAEFRQVSDTLSSVPGVDSVALMEGSLPMQGDSEDPFWIEGKPKPVADNDKPWAIWYEVEPNYLKAMGIPMRRGRFFTDADSVRAPRVMVIDETFAATYFPNEDPIGKRVVDEYHEPAEVVGIVGHVKHWGLDDKLALHAQMYFPFAQIRDKAMPAMAKSVAVVVHAQGKNAGGVMGSIRAAVMQMDRQQVIFAVETMDETISASLADRRFLMILLMVFAALALLLASVGIYGVLSYLVGQRIPEIGIRLALGAQRDDVLRLILGEGLRMAFLGVAIGLAGALALSRLLTDLLFGISAADPVTFAGVTILLTAIAIAACYIPARRAMRVDPIVALRYE